MKICTTRNTKDTTANHTMPKRSADSTETRKRRKLADEVLKEAAGKGDTAAVRAVLEKLPPNSKTGACLIIAARNGHTETVRYLVGLPEVDVNHQDGIYTALDSAVREGHPDVVQMLIDAGADIETKDCDGHSPLHWACRSGVLEVVKMLVEAGAGVNVTDTDGHTCLILAADSGHTETVRYLVGLPEVDVHHCGPGTPGMSDMYNYTALHCAVREGHPDVVRVLIDAGADIETKTADPEPSQGVHGQPPLYFASTSGALEVVKMLVEAGAGVNVTDRYGDTCLFHAVNFGHTETVRYLVGLPEVDVNHRDNDNCTALDFAMNEGNTEMVQVLIDGGAKKEAQKRINKKRTVTF